MAAIAEPIVDPASHKRRVNDLIHESLGEHLRSQPIAFFCECGSEQCFDTVWLSSREYEIGRVGADWAVRAPGH